MVILGAGCSDVTERIAEAASKWNLVTVGQRIQGITEKTDAKKMLFCVGCKKRLFDASSRNVACSYQAERFYFTLSFVYNHGPLSYPVLRSSTR